MINNTTVDIRKDKNCSVSDSREEMGTTVNGKDYIREIRKVFCDSTRKEQSRIIIFQNGKIEKNIPSRNCQKSRKKYFGIC